ncbi:MAG: VanZ family protein [bacterium]|nr:VanZ family protein [bacterium]
MDKKKSIGKIVCQIVLFSILAIYILILFALIFRKRHGFRSVNLIPFRLIADFLFGDSKSQAFAVNNIVGNIVLFIPFGIYLTLFNPNKRIRVNTGIVAIASITVEILQYLFQVGVMDMDDVILNTLGGLIGIVIFKIMYRFLKDKTKNVIAVLAPIAGVGAILFMSFINR